MVVRVRVARLGDSLPVEDVLDLPHAVDGHGRRLEGVEHGGAGRRHGEVAALGTADECAWLAFERPRDDPANAMRGHRGSRAMRHHS